MLNLAIALGGDFGRGSALAQVLADRLAVIGLVGQHHARIAVALLHQRLVHLAVVCLTLAQCYPDRQSGRVAAEVDLRGEAATRAAQGLVLDPPFCPAAQRCARTIVLSIICKASSSLQLSAKVSSMRSQMPELHQRRN